MIVHFNPGSINGISGDPGLLSSVSQNVFCMDRHYWEVSAVRKPESPLFGSFINFVQKQ